MTWMQWLGIYWGVGVVLTLLLVRFVPTETKARENLLKAPPWWAAITVSAVAFVTPPLLVLGLAGLLVRAAVAPRTRTGYVIPSPEEQIAMARAEGLVVPDEVERAFVPCATCGHRSALHRVFPPGGCTLCACLVYAAPLGEITPSKSPAAPIRTNVTRDRRPN